VITVPVLRRERFESLGESAPGIAAIAEYDRQTLHHSAEIRRRHCDLKITVIVNSLDVMCGARTVRLGAAFRQLACNRTDELCAIRIRER
jgi:hypothetical protein